MSHRVFLSYSTKDAEQTAAVCDALEGAGIKCWMAPRDISPADVWAKAIIKAINSSEVLVLMFSAHADASDQVKREVDRAVSKKIPVLIFRISDDEPTDEMEYYLATRQWIDAAKGELSEHARRLIDTIQLGDYAKAGTLAPTEFDEGSIQKALDAVNWALAEIEASDEAVTSAEVDEVFEAALAHAGPIYEAGRHVDCANICVRSARGVLDCLADPDRNHPIDYASHIDAARDSLGAALAAHPEVTPDNAARVCNTLRAIFKDFADRVDEPAQEAAIRWPLWAWLAVMLAINWTALFSSYAVGTVAWDLQFSWPFGPPPRPKVGVWLEFARILLVAAMMIYLLEFTFRTEAGRFFNFASRASWRSKLLAAWRIGMIVFMVMMTYSIVVYHYDTAPENLREYAQDQLNENHELSEEDAAKLEVEAQNAELHRTPYMRYLGYSLVNYIGIGIPLMFVAFYSIGRDARELLDERKACFNTLSQMRGDSGELDRAFEKFYNVCQKKSRRYLILFAWIAGSVAFEQLISKSTLTESALVYEFLASLVVGMATLIWLGFLCHFYEGAYQRCYAEKRRRNMLTPEWENSRKTVTFLYRCVYNHVGGIFAVLYLWPFFSEFARMWSAQS